MSKAASSPTARLLQGSRLFSIPRALPSVNTRQDRTTGAIYSNSATATAPYPLRQALETPAASLASGDWGLKRSLPTRTSARAGIPVVRIEAQDTNDHVTNFRSASDHERTLAKFQEMGMPILKATPGQDAMAAILLGQSLGVSVYEDSIDSTNPGTSSRPWKSSKPWLPILPEYDIAKYVKEVGKQSKEWQEYVMNWHASGALDDLKQREIHTKGFSGPFEALDLETQRRLLLQHLEPTGLTQEPLPAPCKEPREALEHIELKLRRVEAVQQFTERQTNIRAALEAQEATLASSVVTEPADESQTASIRLKSEDLKANAAKEIDRAAQQMLGTDYNSQPLFAVTDLEDAPPGMTEETLRRYNVEKAVAQTNNQTDIDQKKQQDALRKWTGQQLEALKPDAAKMISIMKDLRDEHQRDHLSSTLTSLLVDFLGLPGIVNEQSRRTSSIPKSGVGKTLTSSVLAGREDAAPLSTHPAAGIGYLRSGAYMNNHPIFGPQARRTPLPSRVVRSRSSWLGKEQQAKLGVGGFVTNDPKAGATTNARRHMLSEADALATSFDPDIPGGNKIWVEPTHAAVDEIGRVQVSVLRAEDENVAVRTGDTAEILQRKRDALAGPGLQRFGSLPLKGGSGAPPAR